jgi:hypothetical protein
MAEISIPPLLETESFNAASLNNRFRIGTGSFEGAVNDIPADGVAPMAFNHNHLPTMVHSALTTDFGNGSGATHRYTRTQANGDTGGTPSWAVIDTNGGAGGGTDLQVDFPGVGYNLSGTTVQGVFVACDIWAAFLKPVDDGGGGTPVANRNHIAKFMLQAYNGAAWQNIERSIRWFAAAIEADSGGGPTAKVAFSQPPAGGGDPMGREQHIGIPIRTLIKASDMGNNVVQKVRAVVSISLGQGSLNPNTDILLELWGCQLSAIVIQSTRT